MKQILKFTGMTLVLILSLALFLMGPLYYIPVQGQPVETESVEMAEEEITPEVTVEKDYLGNVIIKAFGAYSAIEKMGIGLFTSITSFASGGLFIFWLSYIIKVSKKKEKKVKVVKEKKTNKANSKVAKETTSIKKNIPQPVKPDTTKTDNKKNLKF